MTPMAQLAVEPGTADPGLCVRSLIQEFTPHPSVYRLKGQQFGLPHQRV
jgi:hypothetical protein